MLGDVSEGWMEVAKKEIDKRIKKYAENEIRFNLLAIIKNRKSVVSSYWFNNFNFSMKKKY